MAVDREDHVPSVDPVDQDPVARVRVAEPSRADQTGCLPGDPLG
jgi:hypothetical protein